jgi:hypothetical protein
MPSAASCPSAIAATVSKLRVHKTEILALGSLAKWPRRCSAAEGTAACGARGRPPGLACSVPGICARELEDGAQPSAPAPRLPRPAGQRLGTPPGRPRRAGGAHLAQRGAAAPRAGAMCPPSGSLQGRALCRPLGCRQRWHRATAGRRCKAAPDTVRNLWQPLRAAQAPGALTARGHIYLAQITPVPVVVCARRTPQCPKVFDIDKPGFACSARGVIGKRRRITHTDLKIVES